MNVSSANLKSMSVDRLTALREQVNAVLSSKIAEERRTMQEQLGKLDRLVESGSGAKGPGRGARGAVPPKYRNPEDPSETWAGRGLKPRWLAAALKSGGKLEHFAVRAPAQAPRKHAPRVREHR